MNWLQQLLHDTDELESPKSFWYYSALAALSAVAKDNVFMDRAGAYILYPNIYVMLLARTGLRKGLPINVAKKLVKKVNNTRVISGRSSIQAILKELGTASTTPGGVINTKSNGFIVSSEFSSSIVEDRAALTILTDLYDRIYNEGEWTSLLKMERFNLKDPTVTMLVGTNDPHFQDFISAKDVHGGFIGRMFVVAETRKHRTNALIKRLKNPLDIDKLVPHLLQVSKVKGEFATLEDTEAGEYYEKWYNELDDLTSDGMDDKTGTIDRIGDAAVKVAMLLSLAQDTSLTISLDQMREAITVCEKLVGNILKKTMTQGSRQTYADQQVIIINELLSRDNHTISRAQLLKKYWMHFNSEQLNLIMQSFDEADNLIKTESIGNQIMYRMPEETARKLAARMEGKMK